MSAHGYSSSPLTPTASPIVLIILFSLAVFSCSADPEPASAPVRPILLGVSRAVGVDQWFLVDGQSRRGQCLNESFRLQTAYGLLQLPVHSLGALDLTQQRLGVDVVITATGDRFSGVLLDPELDLQSTNDDAPVTLRREMISRLVFRLPPTKPPSARPGMWISLHNGDFFHGQIRSGPIRLAIAGEEPRDIALDAFEVVTFPEAPGGSTRVQFAGGETWEGIAPGTDLRIDLDIGVPLEVYSDRVAVLRRSDALPREFAERLGIPATPEDRPAGPSATLMPGLVWIPPGAFELGSPTEEKDRELDEGPLTRIILPEGFWMAAREVTQAEYERLMGRNPSQYTGDDQCPVERVNWQEALDYCRALNQRELAAGRLPDGYTFRLPTEAEWEYACRAGTTTRFSYGDDRGYFETPDYAWCSYNSNSATHPVGTRKPNKWGLFDMHGNVWEWCLNDWTGAYPGGSMTNAVSAPQGSLRVARGGSWLYDPRFCRSSNRDSYGMLNRCSDVGFRVVLAPVR